MFKKIRLRIRRAIMGRKLLKTAMVAHEVNRAYCQAIGDNSQPPWDEAPEWQKKSAIFGVLYHLAHPDSKPSDSHDNWMRDKIKDGWTWGPVKDPQKREHPCMVPFDHLPVEQRAKDHLFLAVVRALEFDIHPNEALAKIVSEIEWKRSLQERDGAK
ncbi:MAG TPA: RyR domain-containing protein [Bacteroidota bacterium]|nr:RyR domain-containing protein [Bacteroidota bacterium]